MNGNDDCRQAHAHMRIIIIVLGNICTIVIMLSINERLKTVLEQLCVFLKVGTM